MSKEESVQANERLLDWADQMFTKMESNPDRQIEVAKVIAMCLHTKALHELSPVAA